MEVLALRSGYRESVESWSELLQELKARGIEAPKLLMADGDAAILGVMRQVWPEAGEQRCWNHKMRNVLDRVAKREQPDSKELLRTIVSEAVDVLEDDRERRVSFYGFPEANRPAGPRSLASRLQQLPSLGILARSQPGHFAVIAPLTIGIEKPRNQHL